MSQPFLGEIKIISWNFPPKGWAFCNGQFLPINQNQALFSILGTQYGGNGQTTFALPDFRGRAPIHQGQGFLIGQAAGQEFHTLTQSEMPAHLHQLNASSQQANQATLVTPPGNTPNILAAVTGAQYRGRVQPDLADAGLGDQRRGQPAAREPHAVSRAELHHRPAGHLPIAQLERGANEDHG